MGIYSTLHANADAARAGELRAELPAPGGPGQVCTSHWGKCEQVEIALESADFNTKIAALAFGCGALGAIGTGIVAGVLATSGASTEPRAGAESAPTVALVPIVDITGGPGAGLAVGGRF
ncbi:MAG: hypothetical protein IT373_38440 [Polyangiaceae bacterium]|nr:hypothetical protein [Polyangiaceae bacterium]